MNQNNTHFIFYVDCGSKRKYIKEAGGKLTWDGFDFEAKKFNHYNLGLKEITRLNIPKAFKIGFVEVKTKKTYGYV